MFILKKIIRLLLVLSFILSFSQLAYCADFFTYTNEKYGFSIDMPYNWLFVPKKQFPTKECQLMSFNQNQTEKFFILAHYRSSFPTPTLNDMTGRQVDDFVNGYISGFVEKSGAKYQSYEPTTIGGYTCLIFKFEGKTQEKIQSFVFIEDAIIVEFYYETTKDFIQNEPSIIQKSINSFKIF